MPRARVFSRIGAVQGAVRLQCCKAGTHEATNRCDMLLQPQQQIASCLQSSDKSHAHIAAIGCSDKSPGVNLSRHFIQN